MRFERICLVKGETLPPADLSGSKMPSNAELEFVKLKNAV